MAKVGRPRKYESPEEMQKAINAYFEACIGTKVPTTVCGLALALGFAQRKSLLDYEGYGEEFCNTVKRAVTTIEANYESMLSRAAQVAGPIFALKNMGWKDVYEEKKVVTELPATEQELEQLLKERRELRLRAEKAGNGICDG